MTHKSPRELESRLERLAGDRDPDPTLTSPYEVVWAEAAPAERPQGMAWDPAENALTFDFWAAQREALDALAEDVDLVGLLGGYRSGKSVTGARWLLTQALEHPGTRHLAMGIDFAKATGSTYRVLFEQLPPTDVRTDLITSAVNGPERSPIVADYNRGEHRLTLTNGSVIKLGAADVWNRYAGDEYAAAWLDEPSHYKDLHPILEMVGSRLTAKAGPKRQFWTLTGNGWNSAWEILEKREDEDGDPIGLAIEVVTATVRDNPYLAPEDVERLERQFADTGREEQALEGGFAAATGLVYSRFSREDHVIPHAEAEERVDGRWRIYGYDAGWKDPRIVIEVAATNYDQFLILDEYHETGSHVEDAIGWLERNDKPRGTIYAEHEPSDLQKFKRAGWDVKPADKSIDAGISELRARLERDANDRVGLLVSDRCEHTIQEFLGYKEDHVGTSSAVDHCLDALRYAVFTNETHGSGHVPTATVRLPDRGRPTAFERIYQ